MSLSSTSLPKPKNWQDFENCTRQLFACVLDDPRTQQNGRTGQKQSGVDVYGYRNVECLVGVQCKKKFEKKVSDKELRDEVNKAKIFKPKISEFILITTAPRDQKIQETARIITQELAKTDHPFSVSVWGWEDVEEHASQHKKAWKAFDPTWNPFVEAGFEKVFLEIEELKQSVGMFQRGGATRTSIPSDEALNESDENSPLHGKITAFQRLIDEGYAHAALKQLKDLKNDEWINATRSERYRILVGIASAKLKLGKQDEAGNLLLCAYNECPEHKNARKNQAKGLLLTKHYKEAAKLATEILADDKSSADAAGTLIRSLIDDSTCIDPLKQVPEALLDTEEVLIAYIHFLRCRNDIPWLNVAKTASKKYPENRILKLFSAEAVLDELVSSDRDAIAGGFLKNITSQEKDNAVETLYAEAKDAIDKGFALLPSTAHNAALALRFSNDLSKAKEILDASIKQYPLDENLRLQRAIIALSENNPTEVLSLLPKKPKDPEAIGVLAEALDVMGRKSDALALIEDIDESNLPDHVKEELLAVRIRAYIAQGKKQLAINTIKQRIAMEPNNLNLKALQINTYRNAVDDGSANNAFEEALALVNDQTSLPLRLLLSLEARKLCRDEAIVNLLKDRVAPDRESDGLQILIASSINSGRWVTARETLCAVSVNLRGRDWFLRADAILALNTGDVATADQKIVLYLNAFPTDTQMILARIGIWQRSCRDNDIRSLLQQLNLAALQGPPEQRIRLASMIVHYGEALKGLEYGYSILMDNWNIPKAHLAYHGLILLNDDIRSVMPLATVVSEDTVVCLLIEGSERRYRIENAQHAFFEDERLDTENDLAVILIGKQAGAKFNLQDRIGSKPVEIRWITPVYLDAFHRSLDQFNERFPRANGLQKFTFDPNSPDPLEDIRAIVKACAGADQRILGDYQSKGIPLAFVATLIGKDPLDVWGGLPTVDMPFQVCRGTHFERGAAIEIVKQNGQAGCVLDAITLSVVRRLGVEKAVAAVCGPIYTTQSVIDLLALRALEAKQNIGKVKGFIAWRGDQLICENYSEKALVRVADECEKEITWARQVVSIVPAMPKKDFQHDARTIINIVGKVACDPAVAADGNNLLLLSEDYGFRIWSAATFEVPTTWLQPVLIIAKEDGHLVAEEYYEAINKLVLSGHIYISLEPNCLMHQVRKDNFEVTREVSRILGMVGGPSADIYTNSSVMSAFIDSVIKECTDGMKVRRIVSEAFRAFAKGRQENLGQLISLILIKMRVKDRFIEEHALGWLIGHSIGMPHLNNLLQLYHSRF